VILTEKWQWDKPKSTQEQEVTKDVTKKKKNMWGNWGMGQEYDKYGQWHLVARDVTWKCLYEM